MPKCQGIVEGGLWRKRRRRRGAWWSNEWQTSVQRRRQKKKIDDGDGENDSATTVSTVRTYPARPGLVETEQKNKDSRS